MGLSNARTIGSVCKRSRNQRDYRPFTRLIDHIPEGIQEVIWIWYKEGMSRRQMSASLLELGVPSPPMKVPWGDSAIRVVVEKYKALEAASGQEKEAQP